MKAVFVHDARYTRYQGEIYTDVEFSYESWQPYLEHFEALVVIGRDHPLAPNQGHDAIQNMNKCSGQRVDHVLFPSLTQFKNYVLKRAQIIRAVEEIVRDCDAVILRGVQENPWIAFKSAKKLGKPVFVEGTGCMWNNTWYYGSLLGKLYAPFRYWRARKVFRDADFVLYVTRRFLQERYPTQGRAMAASDVKLPPPDPHILQRRLLQIESQDLDRGVTFGIIGPVNHAHKGIDNAIKSLSAWYQRTGQPFALHILGRGDPVPLQKLADEHGIGMFVFFDGLVPHEQIGNWLDDLDIYLQPSRTEGLPRATLEAMSRALPTLVSNAGDLPSVSDKAFMYDKHDWRALAVLIESLAGNKEALSAQAVRNFEQINRAYHPDILKKKRHGFLQEFAALCQKGKDI